MMHHYCIYVFDSLTANEAASAIEKGQVENIIQYHSNKHSKQQPHPSMGGPPPSQPPQNIHPQNIIQQPGQSMINAGGPPSSGYPPVPTQHVSPTNNMQRLSVAPPPPSNLSHSSQLYDANLSPQKMKEREGHLNKLGQLAQLTTPAPNMPMTIQPRQMQAQHQLPLPNQQPPQQQQSQPQGPLPSQQPQQQQQPPPPSSQARQITIKTESMQQQALDPISSMEAMSECPNMDTNFTIHHHPSS